MNDALRLSVFLFVLLDPTAATIGAAPSPPDGRDRSGSPSSSGVASWRWPSSRWSPGWPIRSSTGCASPLARPS